MISTIGNAQNREVARGVIKYRRLSDFLSGINFPDFSVVTEGSIGFEELLTSADIVAVREIPDARNSFGRSALVKSDGTYYELRFGQEFLNRINIDWNSFITLTTDVRHVIFEAISDMGRMGPGIVRYRDELFEERFNEYLEGNKNKSITLEDFLKDEKSDESTES